MTGTLVSPNAESYSQFGYSVAVSGDYVIVGAYLEAVVFDATTYYGAGRAYIFNLDTHNNVTLVNPAFGEGECGNQLPTYCEGYFGWSVAISSSDAVVGAIHQDQTVHTNVEGDSGAAYVFSTTTGDSIASLESQNPQPQGFFGYSVSVSGTVVAVGATGETSGPNTEGNTYTFTTSGSPIATISSPHSQASGGFGTSVGVVNGIVAVGAPYENQGSKSDAGRVYTFNATSGKLMKSFTAPEQIKSGLFGSSVALAKGTILIGEPGSLNAIVFNSNSGAFVITLNSTKAQSGSYFGGSVGFLGETAIVGAFMLNPKKYYGAAFLFKNA